jgi:hypothetical protein
MLCFHKFRRYHAALFESAAVLFTIRNAIVKEFGIDTDQDRDPLISGIAVLQ